MQKLYSAITICLLILIAHSKTRAQPGVGATYIGDYSKMTSKDAMEKEMENANWIYRLNNLKNNRYSFTVTLKDNSTREVRSKIYADSLRNRTYLLDPATQQKIYCGQTKSIIRNDNGVSGIATDSCWLFKVVSGQINAYSQLSETGGLNSYYIMAIQQGNGEVRSFTPDLLGSIIRNDAKAEKAYLKKDYYKAIERFNGR